ncbi:TlpA family protein disulfide reductase [Flavobacterium sp.]|jgi:thiol-disulfide isomerase/thioredoxin|uniref:TlpA family protein disulfide reductase n=1 Tax=Flavobacterium sp. TaxID=239 RepID=UPI0037C0E5B9
MHHYKQIILLIMVQFSFCYIGYSQNANKPKPLKVYEKDGFKLKSYNYDGLESYLNHNNDTLYVINFWATWCVPCVKEMPYFEALNQKYKAGKFKMILVSLDFPKMVESRVIPFIQNKKIQAEVVLLDDPDSNSWIEKVAKKWTGAIPFTIIYRNERRKFYEQSFTEQELEFEIKSFIN